MMLTIRSYGIVALTFGSLLIAGCGGGGGGGSGSSNSSDGGSNGGSTGGTTTLTQSDYLPLITGTGWRYSAGVGSSLVDSQVTTASTIAGASSQVYKINATDADITAGLIEHFYTSTPSEVGFWGIQGEIPVPLDFGTATIKSIVFSKGLPYWRDSYLSATSGVAIPQFTATITADVGILANQKFNVTVSDGAVAPQGAAEVDTGYGTLAVQRITVSFSGVISVPTININIDVSFFDTVSFAKGIGIVRRETRIEAAGAEGFTLEQRLENNIGLPEPKRFQLAQGQAVLVGSDDAVRLSSGASLSSSSYSLINTSNPGWVTVEAAAGNVFSVKATGSSVPTAPRGEVFYFKGSSGLPLPMGVSLLSQ